MVIHKRAIGRYLGNLVKRVQHGHQDLVDDVETATISGNQLRKARLERKIPLDLLAAHLGLDTATLARWEDGCIDGVTYFFANKQMDKLVDVRDAIPGMLPSWSTSGQNGHERPAGLPGMNLVKRACAAFSRAAAFIDLPGMSLTKRACCVLVLLVLLALLVFSVYGYSLALLTLLAWSG